MGCLIASIIVLLFITSLIEINPVVGLILLALYILFFAIMIRWASKDEKKPSPHYQSVMEELAKIDSLEGHSFEYYIANLLRAFGLTNVTVTQGSGDYGVDIIAYAGEEKIAIQCKHYAKPVGIKAVQEVYAGKAHYNAAEAVVVTNSTFTDAAFTLAQETGVRLWDRDSLKRMLTEIIEREEQAANTSSK